MMRVFIAVMLTCLIFPKTGMAEDAGLVEKRVLIVSIDGLRPDLALRANTPTIRELMSQGAYSFWAQTTPAAITLPSHVSMLTGCTIEKHGIIGNDDTAAAKEEILVPTIFELAKKAGISTGMSAGKTKFSIFVPQIDHSWIPKLSTSTDKMVAEHAIEILKQWQPRVMFVHFPYVDVAGHADNWGSPEQIKAIENADKQLGAILDELEELKLRDSTYIILSADHGGSGLTHGKDDERSKYIPWIFTGQGVKKGLDLTQFRELTIRTYDTFATACYVMGIKLPDNIDGKPVLRAFPKDLMESNPTGK